MGAHHGGSEYLNYAQWHPCVEISRRADGIERQQRLPWNFVKFYNDPEFVVIPTGCLGLAADMFSIVPQELDPRVMRNKPFPHELDRPAMVNAPVGTNDLQRPGPIGVQFFGPV